MKEQITQLLDELGWIDLGKQKNPYMWSFLHEDSKTRMNIYHTTMTVTLQSPYVDPIKCESATIKDITDMANSIK